jgi:hypothetical protein
MSKMIATLYWMDVKLSLQNEIALFKTGIKIRAPAHR